MAEGGLYETRKTDTGWTPRTSWRPRSIRTAQRLDRSSHQADGHCCSLANTNGPDSGEFFVWYEGAREAWPPECPRTIERALQQMTDTANGFIRAFAPISERGLSSED
jgi:hypothetical protein